VGRLSALGVVVEGPLAQRVVRAMGLPSALVRFEGWRALGRGAGHGVGMSQWGAKGMAERGFEFREILGHYFPGTFLSDLVVRAGLP
jgi:stage II sporulation protein D